MNTTFKTLNNEIKTLNEEELKPFLESLRGKVLFPSDPSYGEACKIWNAMIDRKPALIVKCMSMADAVTCVKFAKANNVQICVRGAGHNIAGKSIVNDVLMIDFSDWRSVRVDIKTSTAHCAPGTTIGDLDHEAAVYGKVASLGINSTTGVGGLCLGGGVGWLSRSFGLTCDNLVSATVILHDGTITQCSKDENTDLFWALRGGMGNFGIVANYEFQLHTLPCGMEVYAGPVAYPLEEAKMVLSNLAKVIKTAPSSLTTWSVIRQAPPFPFLTEDVHFKPVVIIAMCYVGPVEDTDKVCQPLMELGTVLGSHVGRVPMPKWNQAFDPLLTPGFRNYWRTVNFPEYSEGFIDTLVKHAPRVPNFGCEVFVAQMGGRTDDHKPDDAAFAHRGYAGLINCHMRWEKPEDDKLNKDWAVNFFKDLDQHVSKTAYLNFVSEGDETDGIFGGNMTRLMTIKSKYDPDNFFSNTYNIKPKA